MRLRGLSLIEEQTKKQDILCQPDLLTRLPWTRLLPLVGVSLSPTIPLPTEDFSSYAKKHFVLGQDVTGGDEEPPILAVSKNPATPVVDAADMNDAFDPKSPRAVLDHVPNETPNGLNDTVASADECDDCEEYTIQNRWLRVAVPLMMTPFSVGGIYLCLHAFGPCSSSLVCNIQRSRAVLGSIMVVIPQALVQLIVLTTGGKQWGYWCSFTAGLLFEGAGLLISLLVALSTPTFDVIGDWLLAVSVQSISWYFSTWAICVRAKKHSTGRKTRESDIFLNRKGNGDCLGFIAAYFMYVVNVTAARVRATNNTTTTDADFVGDIFLLIGQFAVGILSSCAVCACCLLWFAAGRTKQSMNFAAAVTIWKKRTTASSGVRRLPTDLSGIFHLCYSLKSRHCYGLEAEKVLAWYLHTHS